MSQTPDFDRSSYFRQYRERQRKFRNLEAIVSNLTSPQKHKVINTFSKRHGSSGADLTINYEPLVCESLISYLKLIWKKGSDPTFHKVLFEIFSIQLEQETFVRWLADKLSI